MPRRRKFKTLEEAADVLDAFSLGLERGDRYSAEVDLLVIDVTQFVLERMHVSPELFRKSCLEGIRLLSRITSLLPEEDRQQRGSAVRHYEFVERHLKSLAPLDRRRDAEAVREFAAALRAAGGDNLMAAKHCLKRLDEMVAAAEQIEALIGDESRLDGAAKAEARNRLRRLKETLNAERKRMRRARSAITDAERLFYQPAVEQAAACLTLRVNSVPGRSWLHELHDLRTTLDAEELRRELRESFRFDGQSRGV